MSDFDETYDKKQLNDSENEEESKIANYPFGKFLTHVRPEDLDEQGRFICKEPVLIIGSNAFHDVQDKLTYVEIHGVLSIEEKAFAGCVYLEKADIDFEPDNEYLENYDGLMFWKRQIVNRKEDFENCLDAYMDKYGKNNVHIRDGAFNGCIRLKSFHFPDRIVLHESPFRLCNSMTEITFDGSLELAIKPENLDKLKEYEMPLRCITFKDCSNVQKINFFDSDMVDIDELVQFENLKEINFPASTSRKQSFWSDAVRNYPNLFLILPSDLYKNARFLDICLSNVYEGLSEIFEKRECHIAFNNLVKRKKNIENEKEKIEKEERKRSGRTAPRVFE